MQVKRFVASNMRRALELVRSELGPEAVILSSRRTKQGVEILTTLEAVAQMDGSQPCRDFSDDTGLPMASDSAWRDQAGVDKAVAEHSATVHPLQRLPQYSAPGIASGKTSVQLAEEIERAQERMLEARRATAAAQDNGIQLGATADRSAWASEQKVGLAAKTNPVATDVSGVTTLETNTGETPVLDTSNDSHSLHELKSELEEMRQLLEEQLDRLSSRQVVQHDPTSATLWRRFSRMGLSAEDTESVLAGVNGTQSLSQAWAEALGCLAHRIPVVGKDIIEDGGVFAFVGPTGVGKTTTIGKLAARYVLKHGADQLALITTDTYRIAAHDQLRSLGRILKVPVFALGHNRDLSTVLGSLRHCALILIDTAGFRHGDPILKQQLNVLSQHKQVQSYMVLSCNSQLQMMKASMHAYKTAGLKGCVLTKLDETASLGETLGLVMRHQLPIAYTTHGQDIPQDIAVCRAHQLVTRAVKLMKAGYGNYRCGAENTSSSKRSPCSEKATKHLY